MNAALNTIGRLMFAPFSAVPPGITIAVLAAVLAALSLLVFKWTSNQEKIRAAKAPLKGHLLGILLYRHDLRIVFRSLGSALGISLANLRFLVVPMLVMIGPLLLLFVQMEFRLGSDGLAPGEATVLRVKMKEGRSLDDVTVRAPEAVAVESPGVRVASARDGLSEVDFRIRAVREGTHLVVVSAGGLEVTKSVTVARGPALVSPLRPATDFFEALLHPIEPPVPEESPVKSIELGYAAATYPVLGIDFAWWVLFLIVMVLALFLLRGPMGIDF